MELNVPTIYKGSILELDVDVIVNPANSFLWNGAGLARVIHQAAYGPGLPKNRLLAAVARKDAELEAEARAQIKYGEELQAAKLIPYGGAALTSAGSLPHKGIIHAVGPIWGGGDYHEANLLYSVFSECLTIAEDAGFESIAFPAISAGIFGCPIELVAKAAATMTTITDLAVVFALMDDEHIKAFRAAIDRALRVVDVQ